MQLSTKGRYAVMALLDLAMLQAGNTAQPVTLADIAERQQISLSYLEQLFAKLRQAGLVRSVRGPGGGYVLAKDMHELWLNDVINAVSEGVDITRCGQMIPNQTDHSGCMGGVKCNAHDLWASLSGHIDQFLGTVSLGMVLQGQVAKVVPAGKPVQVRVVS